MRDYTIVDYKGLRAMGIPYSRVHLLRLEKLGLFVKRIVLTPAGRRARVGWYRELVQEWLRLRGVASGQGDREDAKDL